MNISDLIPDKIKVVVNAIIDKSEDLLQGETARMIGYGGGLAAWALAHAIKAIPDVSLADALAQVALVEAALLPFIESIRHFVSSPKTVARLIAESAGPVAGTGPQADALG